MPDHEYAFLLDEGLGHATHDQLDGHDAIHRRSDGEDQKTS